MNVDLTNLRPNPTRDFDVDPIDPARVEMLRKSIRDYGFWSGVICRKTDDGVIQIGAGHTRVQAAILEGITRADVCVSKDMDDHTMKIIYGIENATQRGNLGSSRVGTVAASLKQLALREAELGSENSEPRHGGSRQGIGSPQIAADLIDIPGVNIGTVQQDLASLKQSGDYNRIMEAVEAELAQRAEDARIAAERDAANKKKAEEAKKAKEAREKAKKNKEKARADPKNDRKFDRAGVQKFFENPAQLDVFRKLVTSRGVAELLPVDQQKNLARQLREKFEAMQKTDKHVEFSSAFIRTHVMEMVIQAKREAQELTRKEQERLMREKWEMQIKVAINNFGGACRRMQAEGMKIKKLLDERPENLEIPRSRNLREDLLGAQEIINTLLGQGDTNGQPHRARKSLVR